MIQLATAIIFIAVIWLIQRDHREQQAAQNVNQTRVLAQLLKDQREQQAAWEAERRELVNRIQAPERIPLATPQVWEVPEPEPDESQLVGTIAPPFEPDEG